jgi:hypothetical protein
MDPTDHIQHLKTEIQHTMNPKAGKDSYDLMVRKSTNEIAGWIGTAVALLVFWFIYKRPDRDLFDLIIAPLAWFAITGGLFRLLLTVMLGDKWYNLAKDKTKRVYTPPPSPSDPSRLIKHNKRGTISMYHMPRTLRARDPNEGFKEYEFTFTDEHIKGMRGIIDHGDNGVRRDGPAGFAKRCNIKGYDYTTAAKVLDLCGYVKDGRWTQEGLDWVLTD